MTEFLLRRIIPNGQDFDDSDTRASVGRIAGIAGIICNFFLSVTKLLAGAASGSVAIMADAVNNLSDAISSIVTLIGFQLAQRPADKDHPFGHARYEYLAGLVVAELILLVGFELAKTSLDKIIHPEKLIFSYLTLGILIFSIIVKLWMFFFFRTLGKLIHSQTLSAASIDSRNDVVTTASVLLCCLISRFFGINLDGWAGIAVAFFIFWSGIKVTKDTISPLLGTQADRSLVNDLSELVNSHDKILGTHDLLVHDYGPGQCFASVHAEMDSKEDPIVSHDLLEHIESEALDDMNVHLVIHYDPVATNDEKWNSYRQLAEETVQTIDPVLTIHDFRILNCNSAPAIAFDLSIPFEYPVDPTSLTERIQYLLSPKTDSIPVIIHVDQK